MTFQFPPRREDDDLGPPPPVFRIPRQRVEFRSFGNYNRWIILGVILILCYVTLNTLKSIYVDWLWFDGVGYRSVYSKVITTQAWLFVGGVAIFLVYFGANAYYAARPLLRTPGPGLDDAESASLRRVYLLTLIAGSIFLALIFGTIAATHWDVVLVYLNGQSFGVEDPQFGQDIGFYVFDLPALRFFYGWAMGAAVMTVLVAAGLYLVRYLLLGPDDATTRQSRIHLAMLLLVIVILFIFRYWLDRYELVFSTNGVVFGATYTDVHARLPFIYVSIALAAITGVALLASVVGRSVMLPMGAAGAWAVVVALGGSFYPASVQRFTVQPNELQKESEYIQRNIEFTRAAFGLDQIDERPFPAAEAVTKQEVQDNPETMNNIRLLDVDPLLQTYGQIQLIRPLYEFTDVDIDRYEIDGVTRQMMVAARELSPNNLPVSAQSWVNKRLQFTHGYGVVMSPVNEVVQEGLPNLYMRDIPVTGKLPVSRPEIYYGEQPDHYVIVKTTDQEFDYPEGDGNAQTVFEGEGGAALDSIINRLAFAWEFGDVNILISGSITSESRVLFRRNIQQRVEELAPFLTLDQDPYLVLADGKLWWIQDAYTTSSLYPYSQPLGPGQTEITEPLAGTNYIRNSVKAVIDAYDGSTTLYLTDEEDPIIQTYAKIFPDLLTPLEEMPESLQAHLRYPESLFLAQVDQYRTYHITDPGVLYNKEDIWQIPTEIFENEDVPVEPYYVIMRIPGESTEEFALILPLTPARRQNTIAWVAARSDGDNYGKLLSFRFPTNALVFGPRQVESRIDQDPAISAQFSLWSQSGSNVIRGNLLMVPIGQGNLFVEPIYLQSSTSQLPELKRIVVANGNRIAMEPTLERSLAVVFGEVESSLPSAGTLPGSTPTT
ncbi:MAG TPA: UPF0182 family protein, partial [Dehalococcoidia bacterium]|nr:UPF0182 family protein [Dehalococcoidia bacterium]